MKDLVILVPGKNEQFTLFGLLGRPRSLGIRQIEFDIFVHPNRDPGIFNQSSEFLRPFIKEYAYGLVFLDREGSGQEHPSAMEIEDKIENNLRIAGWEDRAKAIAFDPELEIWAWARSNLMAQILGWSSYESLLNFLKTNHFFSPHSEKPERPKEAFEKALREKRIQRSSSIYRKIALEISFQNCRDRAFGKFRATLLEWFGTN